MNLKSTSDFDKRGYTFKFAKSGWKFSIGNLNSLALSMTNND